MSRSLSYIFPAGNNTDVCLTKDIGGAGTLILDGNLVDKVTNTLNFLKYGYSRQLSCTTTQANNVIFTINGIQNGVFITENLTANNNTVYSVQVYDVITSISINRVATGVRVGTGWKGFFPLIAINLERDVINYTLTLARLTAASVSFSVYGTLDNIVNNRTYLDRITNNDANLFQIQAPSTTANYVYSGLTGTYTYILVQLGADVGTIANSMKLNFIQI
jgi:hypothetical protein